jgi:hypothetical protein
MVGIFQIVVWILTLYFGSRLLLQHAGLTYNTTWYKHQEEYSLNLFMLPSMVTVLSSRVTILVTQKMVLVLCAGPTELL